MKIGFSRHDITPNGKIAIAGNIPARYTDKIKTRLYATALVLESNGEYTVWVSLDMCHIVPRLYKEAYIAVKEIIPSLKEEHFIINATHSTAYFYVTNDEFLCDKLTADESKIMPLDTTRNHICFGIKNACKKAIDSLTKFNVSIAFSELKTGYCRRVVYKDNTAVMYGDTTRSDFLRMEYPDSTDLQMIYFNSTEDNSLLGVFCAVPCPAQADEVNVYITADYWDTVRNDLYKEFGNGINIVTCCRSAGELSPHKKLSTFSNYSGETYGPEIAEKLGHNIAKEIINFHNNPLVSFSGNDIDFNLVRINLDLPIRQYKSGDLEKAIDYFNDKNNFDDSGLPIKKSDYFYHSKVVAVNNEKSKTYRTNVTVIKMGNIVIYTAPTELFCEYANRINAYFPKYCMFDIQLVNDCVGYLPPKEAIERGGYSADFTSTITDHIGGEMFVEETIKAIKEII